MAKGDLHARYEYLPIEEIPDRQLIDMCTDYFDQEAADYDDFDERSERRSLYLSSIDEYVANKLSSMVRCDLILSFGCGTGRRERRIADMTPHRPAIVGIERSAAMRAIAASRGIRVIPEIQAAGRPSNDSADVVLCLYSFMHLPSISSRRKTLSALAESLRPGGLLILDVFNLHDKFEWPSKLRDGGSGVRPPLAGEHRGDVLYRRAGQRNVSFMHYFTLGEIVSLLEAAGLVITDLTGVGHGHQPGRQGVPLDEGCLLLTCTKAIATATAGRT